MKSLAIHAPSALRRLSRYRSRMQAHWLALGLDVDRGESESKIDVSRKAYNHACAVCREYRELLVEQGVIE